jgi:hypothetical protein
VLAVIGRGASVVTLLAWNLAARNPNKVAPTSVIRHQLLAIHAFPDALCRPSTQQRRPERQHRNTNSSVSMMWGVCGSVTSRDWNEKITIFIVILTYFFIVSYIR